MIFIGRLCGRILFSLALVCGTHLSAWASLPDWQKPKHPGSSPTLTTLYCESPLTDDISKRTLTDDQKRWIRIYSDSIISQMVEGQFINRSQYFDLKHNILLPNLETLYKRFQNYKISHLSLGGYGITFQLTENSVEPPNTFLAKIAYSPDRLIEIQNGTRIRRKLSSNPLSLQYFAQTYSFGENNIQYQELLPGNSLKDLIEAGAFDVKDFQNNIILMHEMTMALKIMHDSGITHNDIKPKNFVVETSPQNHKKAISVKLIDLDFSQDVGALIRSPIGTPGFYTHAFKAGSTKADPGYDIRALKYSFQTLLLYKKFKDLSLPSPNYKENITYKKSPYALDKDIDPMLSAIAFFDFESTTDILNALEMAQRNQRTPKKFFEWFYLHHLSRERRDYLNAALNASPELVVYLK